MMSVFTEKKSIETIDHKFLISGHSHMECDTDHSVIERAKRKTTMKINHPYDWVQLMRSCKKKTPFIVKVLDIPDFYNFAQLLKGPLLMKEVNEDGVKFVWKEAQWLRYSSEAPGIHKTGLP
ncbi:hypothetical protein QE152_g33199 [Popillia japonica]|uniref:Uncharacterized protein n=1 Tax=Popillia japonica TaxID=7064 RepID=A0AAW1IXG4_POPJA